MCNKKNELNNITKLNLQSSFYMYQCHWLLYDTTTMIYLQQLATIAISTYYELYIINICPVKWYDMWL